VPETFFKAFGLLSRLYLTLSQTIDSKDGEMSEWLKEHAWSKAGEVHQIAARRPKAHSFKNLGPKGVAQCDALSVGIRQRFESLLKQFLHSF
jgi:hypothetical protein